MCLCVCVWDNTPFRVQFLLQVCQIFGCQMVIFLVSLLHIWGLGLMVFWEKAQKRIHCRCGFNKYLPLLPFGEVARKMNQLMGMAKETGMGWVCGSPGFQLYMALIFASAHPNTAKPQDFFFGFHEQIWWVPWKYALMIPTMHIAQVDLKGVCFFLNLQIDCDNFSVSFSVWAAPSWFLCLYLAHEVGVISPDCRHRQCAHHHLSQLFWGPFRVTGDKQILLGYNSSDVVGLREIVPVSLNWLKMH